LSISIEKIYINLPWGVEQKKEFSATIPLKKRKKINAADIIFAKKYLQDTYLDWDDFCIHNFVLSYEAEGAAYSEAPIGLIAKKIKLNSCLVWVKDKFRKDTETIFSNLEKNFAGFVSPFASITGSVFTHPKDMRDSCAIIDIAYDKTFILVFKNKRIAYIKETELGLKKIFDELEKKIILAPALAKEVFNRYISFKEMPHSKEVSIKTDTDYINLSTQAASNFVKDYIKTELAVILEDAKKYLSSDASLYVCGRLNAKEGFCDFLKSFLAYDVKLGNIKDITSKSFGALNYGMSKFLEEGSLRKDSFFGRVVSAYKEYF
jgi:cell division ATPase FtsA